MTTLRSTTPLDRNGKCLFAFLAVVGLVLFLSAPTLAKGKRSDGPDGDRASKSASARTSERSQPSRSSASRASDSAPRRTGPSGAPKSERPPAPVHARSESRPTSPPRERYRLPDLSRHGAREPGDPDRTPHRSSPAHDAPPVRYQPPAKADRGPGHRTLPGYPVTRSGDKTPRPPSRGHSEPAGGGPRYQPPKPADGGPSPWRTSSRTYGSAGKSSRPPDSPPSGRYYGGGRPAPTGAYLTPAPASAKRAYPPSGHGRPSPGGGQAPRVSYRTYYDREAPPRVSFRGRDEWRPPHHGYWAHGDDWWPVGYRRYHRYYYHCEPGVFVYSGWGSSWYDPWWSGPYWWPSSGTVVYRNTYNSYTYPLPPRYEGSYEYPAPPTGSPYYQAEPWMDAELRRALADVAAAWTTGDIRSFQAHLTPGAAVAVRYEWEQEQPWVLAPPVLLDIVSQALQGQRDSRFRFVQAQQMESGLVWAVAEHSFRPENEPERVEATQEYMFRRHDQAWLVEAVTARPQRYWWLASAVLDDAAAESRRLIEEMDRARAQEPGR